MKANWSQDLYLKAWHFATAAHQGQTYKGPIEGQRIPYINHIGSVAMETIYGVYADPSLNGDLAIQCALLHDTVEDTDITLDCLYRTFGHAVAQGVSALTKDASLATKTMQMQDSLARIRLQPKEIGLVKMADRISNLSEPPAHWSNDKKMQYRDEALMIYDMLKESSACLASRLRMKIDNYAQYIEMTENS